MRQSNFYHTAAALLLLSHHLACGFVVCCQHYTSTVISRRRAGITQQLHSTKDDAFEIATTATEVKQMRVKELKTELQNLGIDYSTVFEKEGLVELLLQARTDDIAAGTKSDANTASTTAATATTTTAATEFDKDTVRIPMTFYSMESGIVTDAKNAEQIFLRPSPGQFASIQLHMTKDNNNNNNNNGGTLAMLVDTACTAVVVRPSTVRKFGLPNYGAGATMTAAGGTNMGGALTQIDRFTVDCSSSNSNSSNKYYKIFGPLPSAVQDIGALPSALDGIIGLSFLSQFSCVDFDFRSGHLILHGTKSKSNAAPLLPLLPHTDLQLVGEANLYRTRMGVWAADVTLDGRGPVKMLVDTGAASTILNWRGVADMSLSKDSELIPRNLSSMGAMGADNVAFELSHRYMLQQQFGVGNGGGMGMDVRSSGGAVALDVGDLPILDILKAEGIGGLLGADLIMRCDVARFYLSGAKPSMALYR